MLKWVIKAVVAGCLFGLMWAAGMVVSNILRTSDIFTVLSVEVQGVSHTDLERLKKVYQPYVGKNIFNKIVPSNLMTEDPWVIKMEMKRVLPNKLLVIVQEEKPLMSYKIGGKCMSKTLSGQDIPTQCDDSIVVQVNGAHPNEVFEFAEIYRGNDFLKDYSVVLNNGLFTVKKDNMTIKGIYTADVFNENYSTFVRQIVPRYKKIDSVDITVRGRVFVKGVTNG